jgi:hypothetical protein
MMRASRSNNSGLVLVISLATWGAACGSNAREKSGDPAKGFVENGSFGDFPGALVEQGAPAAAPFLFKNVRGESVAPCLIEPESGTLYPKNWLPPRFTWSGGGSNVYELRIHANNQAKDLTVYTSGSSWTMPKEIWKGLQNHSADGPITVELRGAIYNGRDIQAVTSTNHADLAIAPVEAPGSIVFWSIADGDEESRLKGLTIAKEGVVDVLRRNDMPANGESGRKCIGCHTATPDGKSVAVAWQTEAGDFSNDVARIEKGAQAGPRPTYVTAAATTTLGKGTRTLSTFSRAHWAPGDRVMLTNDDTDLVWIDLEAEAPTAMTGVLGKAGDPNERRLGPSWSRDGSSIVYMSGALGKTPFEFMGPSDLYVMPFAGRAGATTEAPAMPLVGASSPSTAEYYPALSPDDAWVAFNALPDNGRLYDNPNAELFIVPRAGGERIRLRANDPPSCSTKVSPGITNSWPKWAPEVQEHNGRKFYFVVFSSRRHAKTEKPQLYVSPIVVEANGAITSFPAVYIRNQESFDGWERWGNHTPAWDEFAIESEAVVK